MEYLLEIAEARNTFVPDGWYLSKPKVPFAYGPFATEQDAIDYRNALTNKG